MSAEGLQRLHFWLTLVWLAAIPFAVITGLIESLVFISAISIYANVAGHFSAWQAARAEQAADSD